LRKRISKDGEEEKKNCLSQAKGGRRDCRGTEIQCRRTSHRKFAIGEVGGDGGSRRGQLSSSAESEGEERLDSIGNSLQGLLGGFV